MAGGYPTFREGMGLRRFKAREMQRMSDAAKRFDNMHVVAPLYIRRTPSGVRMGIREKRVAGGVAAAGNLVGVVVSVRPKVNDARLTVRPVEYTYSGGGQNAKWAGDPFQVLPAFGHVAIFYESSHCDREVIIRDAPNYTVIVPKDDGGDAPEARLLEAPYLGYRTGGAGGDRDGFPYMARIIVDSRSLNQPTCTYEPLILSQAGFRFSGTGIKRSAICAPGYRYGDYVHLGFTGFLSGSTLGSKNFRLIHSVRSFQAAEDTFTTGGVVMEYIERP